MWIAQKRGDKLGKAKPGLVLAGELLRQRRGTAVLIVKATAALPRRLREKKAMGYFSHCLFSMSLTASKSGCSFLRSSNRAIALCRSFPRNLIYGELPDIVGYAMIAPVSFQA